MTKLAFLTALLLGACVDDPTTSAEAQALLGATDCSVPGALADDGVDDRAAIQAALDTKGCADLGPGRYDIATGARVPGVYAMLLMHGSQHIRGVGPATVLSYSGDAALADWYAIEVSGDRARVEDLTIDTSALTNASEQTHAIQVVGTLGTGNKLVGPATGQAVRGVTFLHSLPNGPSGGDCIKVIGYPAGNVVGLDVEHNNFLGCARDGFGVHSGLDGLQLVANLFAGVRAVPIASEDGYAGGQQHWSITANTVLGAHGSPVVLDLTDDVSLVGNTLVGGGIYVYGGDNIAIGANVAIKTDAADTQGVIHLEKDVTYASVTGGVYIRATGAALGPVVEIEHHGTGYPAHISLNGVHLVQGTNGAIVNSTSSPDVSIVGCLMDAPGQTGGTSFGVQFTGILVQATRLLVSNNVISSGGGLAAVRISGSYLGIGRVSNLGNVETGYAQGLRCETATGIVGPLVSTGNNGAPNTAGCVTTTGN